MATDFRLRRQDRQPLGTFDEVQSVIRRQFPDVEFFWTTSGDEKLRMAKERGIELPPEVREMCKGLPSLLEGVAEGDEYHISFGLGHEEPITCLYITPRGTSPTMYQALTAMEEWAGNELQITDE